MPLVLITRGPRVTDEELQPLLESVCQIVAEGLTVPGTEGELNADEIEVAVTEAGPLDQNMKDIAIIVWANVYPERLENFDDRRSQIAGRMMARLPGKYSGSLWVLLQPGSYQEW